jgi:hypothetical protein
MWAQCKNVLSEILPFFLLRSTQDTLSQIFPNRPLICILLACALVSDGIVAQHSMTSCH